MSGVSNIVWDMFESRYIFVKFYHWLLAAGVDACVAALGPGFEGTGPCEADYTCPVAGEVCVNGGEVCCAPTK